MMEAKSDRKQETGMQSQRGFMYQKGCFSAGLSDSFEISEATMSLPRMRLASTRRGRSMLSLETTKEKD
jgi:23S rRNA C2498 (ribose-2'-O)-methylase RlmM